MFVVLLFGSAIVAMALGYNGLFGAGLKFSKDTMLTGRAARIIGALCSIYAIAALCAGIWLAVVMLR